MIHLTSQEKSVVIGFCVIIFIGTIVHIGLIKNICVFDWLHTAQKNSASIQININRASVEELLRVPGIGPKTAQFIMSYRHTKGVFTNLETLRQARGMSPSRYERIIKHLKI